MPPTEAVNITWLFVTHTTLHLERLKKGDESWWCVDRGCKLGERAFIYKALNGIFLYFEILELPKTPEMFCNSYQMATARIKVLNVFDPPISSKQLKASEVIRAEGFVRRNFQGKSFALQPKTPRAIIAIVENETPRAIIALARKQAKSSKPPAARRKT